MKMKYITLILVLLMSTIVIGASRIPIPKPVVFGNETTTTSELTTSIIPTTIPTTTIRPITTTTTVVLTRRIDWMPSEFKDTVIIGAGVTDNPAGGIKLRNGLVIKRILINTLGQNVVIDMTGTSYDLIREAYTTLGRTYQVSIDPTYNILTVRVPAGMTDSQLKYNIGIYIIYPLSTLSAQRYGEIAYNPVPIADTTLI